MNDNDALEAAVRRIEELLTDRTRIREAEDDKERLVKRRRHLDCAERLIESRHLQRMQEAGINLYEPLSTDDPKAAICKFLMGWYREERLILKRLLDLVWGPDE